MTRRGCIALAFFALAGCATTALEHRIAALERENAELRTAAPRAASVPTSSVRHPATLRQPPFVATVDFKPPTCSGGLCMEVENDRPHDVAGLAINGEDVLVQGRAYGGRIPPDTSAFVRLPAPGHYVFEAILTERIPTLGRALPTNIARETCRVAYAVGGVGNDRPRLTFSVLTCRSPVGKL